MYPPSALYRRGCRLWLVLPLLSVLNSAWAQEPPKVPRTAAEVQEAFQSHWQGWGHPPADSVWDLAWLPADVKYSVGEISLIPDRGFLYLIDARLTDRADGRSHNFCSDFLRLEIQTPEGWHPLKENDDYADDVLDESTPLRPGQFMVLSPPQRNPVPTDQEAEGEVRWSLGTDLHSATKKLIYDRRNLDKWVRFSGDGPLLEMSQGRNREKWGTNYVAQLELRRCLGPSPGTRALVRGYLDGDEKNRLTREVIDKGQWPAGLEPALHRVLAEEWPETYDQGRLVRRLVTIVLQAPPVGEQPFGFPEVDLSNPWGELVEAAGIAYMLRYDSVSPAEYFSRSRNPWKLDDATVQALIAKAKEVAKQPGEKGIAAAKFLRFRWIPTEAFSEEELKAYLDSPNREDRSCGCLQLMKRGEAGKVMDCALDLARKGDAREAAEIWETCRAGVAGIPQGKEQELLEMILRENAGGLEIMVSDSCYGPLLPFGTGKPLPAPLRSALADCLKKELASEETSKGMDPEILAKGLQLLAEGSRDAESWTVLNSYLSSPVADYVNLPNRQVKFYPLRMKAKELMEARGEKVDPDIILQEPATVWEAINPYRPR